MAASKHDKNCPFAFISSNFQCHILSRCKIVWKLTIFEISFFTHKPECRNWLTGNFLGTLRYFFCLCSFPIIFSLTVSRKRKPTEICKVNLFCYWNQYYQSHNVTSTKAAKIVLNKKEWSDARMKSQTNDTWNRQVVWNKSECQIVLYEVTSCKMEISWLQENQTLNWPWRKH